MNMENFLNQKAIHDRRSEKNSIFSEEVVFNITLLRKDEGIK